MAHGGTDQWNKTVKKAVKDAQLPYPYKIVFGKVGDTPAQGQHTNFRMPLRRSERQRIAFDLCRSPSLISSYSEVDRQWKYLLGVDVQPGFMNNLLFPVQKHSTIYFAEPLNDSAVVVEILLDRTHEISSTPNKEAVIIVAHGPNDDSDNAAKWNQILQRDTRPGVKETRGV